MHTETPPANPGLTTLDSVSGISTGLDRQADGTWLALTASASKTFKTLGGAQRWLAGRGYLANGTRVSL